MLRNELHTKKAEIEAAAKKYGAKHIRIFGSVARGEENPDSDIDFLVDLPKGYDLFLQRMPLTEDLAKITERKIDLVPEHELNVHMRDYCFSAVLMEIPSRSVISLPVASAAWITRRWVCPPSWVK